MLSVVGEKPKKKYNNTITTSIETNSALFACNKFTKTLLHDYTYTFFIRQGDAYKYRPVYCITLSSSTMFFIAFTMSYPLFLRYLSYLSLSAGLRPAMYAVCSCRKTKKKTTIQLQQV